MISPMHKEKFLTISPERGNKCQISGYFPGMKIAKITHHTLIQSITCVFWEGPLYVNDWGSMNLVKKSKILIVEDEELICWSLKHSFERAGEYYVKCSHTGDDALQLLSENEYDVVITDLRLPDIDGFGIVEKIRGLTKNTPVIVISAHLTDPAIDDVRKHGVFSCINKPFEIQDVMGDVKEAMKFRA